MTSANPIVIFLMVVLAIVCFATAYKFPTDPVLQPLALGTLASLVTSWIVLGIQYSSDGRHRQMLGGMEQIYLNLRAGSERFNGTWIRASGGANAADDPNRFWMVERLSPEECSNRLVMVGASHRTIFSDVTPDLQKSLVNSIKQISKNHGRVCIFFPPDAPTRSSIEGFFRTQFTAAQLKYVELYVLPAACSIRYSCLLNDKGLWLLPKFYEVTPDRAMLLEIRKDTAEYFYRLYETDLDLLARRSSRVDWAVL